MYMHVHMYMIYPECTSPVFQKTAMYTQEVVYVFSSVGCIPMTKMNYCIALQYNIAFLSTGSQLCHNISHLVYLYYSASRGLTRIFSLHEGYKGKYGS